MDVYQESLSPRVAVRTPHPQISPPPPFLSSAFLSAGFILRQLSPLLAKTPLSQLQAHIQWGQLRAGSHWTDLGHVSIPEAVTGSDPLA